MTEEALVQEALSQPPEVRAAFLDRACAGRPGLRAAVEARLAVHAKSGGVPERPPGGPGQTANPDPAPGPTLTGERTPRADGAPAPPEATADYTRKAEAGAVVADRYTLVEKIGEGGMGEVWIARQTEPVRRKVALKLIKAGMDSRAVLARFEQERQALALMEHPNIARVLDGGMTPDRRPFFVMELVNGQALTRFCDEARLSPRDRLELFVPICQAVQHAHQKGIIHRDLKPSNILVTVIDGKPVPKVIDFGVAKATSGRLTEESLSTQLGAIVGTLEYMSPEQADFTGEDVDTRADIYSLGVILYELLTGLRPIDAVRLKKATLMEMIRIIREEEPSKPSTRLSTDPSLPSQAALRQTEPRRLTAILRGELDWVVMKCLEKRRDRRYETASGLAKDIRRYLDDEPVEARPPSAGYRLGKLLRRHKGPVTAAALVAAALVLGIAVATTQAIRARRAEARAVADRERAEESFKQARAAVDRYFTTVSESKLLNVPGMQPLRKDLLDAARAYYLDFLKQRGDDPAVKAEAAAALFRVGWVGNQLGDARGALGQFTRATELYGELVARDPRNLDYRRRQAMCYGAQGVGLENLRRFDEATAAYKQALAIREALLAEDPNDPQSRIDVARTHRNLGSLYRTRNLPKEAIAEWDTALALGRPLLGRPLPKASASSDLTRGTDLSLIVREDVGSILLDLAQLLFETGRLDDAAARWKEGTELFEALARDVPGELAFRSRLGDALSNGADLHYSLGRVDDAFQYSRRSLEIRDDLAARNRAVPFYQRALVESTLGHAWLLLLLKRDAEALETYRRATERAETLLAELPGDATTRNHLAQSLAQQAFVLQRLGRAKEGLPLARRADEIQTAVLREKPDSVYHQSALGIVLRCLGRSEAAVGNKADAIRAFERAAAVDGPLTKDYPEAGESLACDFALMIGLVEPSKREELAARSISELREAIAKGYRNLRQLKIDEDLDVLRDRDDFKKLMAELQKVAEKK